MQQILIGKNQAGQRFDKYLIKLLPGCSKSFLYKMLRKKNITLNHKKAVGNELLKLADEVNLFFAEETFLKFSSVEKVDYTENYYALKKIEILYEDSNIIVLNKPVGVLTQKAVEDDISLNEWLIGYLLVHDKISKDELNTFKPAVCNRLDRNTSGIVLCGKTLIGSQTLSQLIKERKIHKFYRTLVWGALKMEASLEGYLRKDVSTNRVSIFPTEVENSSYISTQYKTIDSSPFVSELEVELITGKTHQIRAHLASISHPIVGDYKYNNRRNFHPYDRNKLPKYQILHAFRVEFPADCGKLKEVENKVIIAPLPDNFIKVKDYIYGDLE